MVRFCKMNVCALYAHMFTKSGTNLPQGLGETGKCLACKLIRIQIKTLLTKTRNIPGET